MPLGEISELYQPKTITSPEIKEQGKIVAQIQKIEEQISKLNKRLRAIKNQELAILKKYL